METIENKPLTKYNDLPIEIAEEHHLDLTQNEIPDLAEKLLEIVKKVSKIKGVIVTAGFGNPEDGYVMANVTPNKRKNKTLIFPEPNPVIIYFNAGIEHIHNTIIIRKEILNSDYHPEDLYPIFSDFYKEAFQGITQMIMSMESLFNQKIPENEDLEFEGTILTKDKIEWKDFKTKFRYLIPLFTGINLYNDYLDDYQNIIKLYSLRNRLVHLKSLRQDNFTHYQKLCKELIDFDYETNCKSIHKILIMLL